MSVVSTSVGGVRYVTTANVDPRGVVIAQKKKQCF